MPIFKKEFTSVEPLPERAIERAVEVMRTGRLHRYCGNGEEPSEVDLLELEFAEYQGTSYALACASCGYAMQAALISSGLQYGEPVLANAFTLAPVPGAIHHAGGRPVLVETTKDYQVDLKDLTRKAKSSRARFLLLSHMRGHISDMEAVVDLCRERGITLVEDCAHTMGAEWAGCKSGSFGSVACFSTQSYKHLNSGEGGILTTNDPDVMAQAVILSGSYMYYHRHRAAPPTEVLAKYRWTTPNVSGRMDNMRAAVLRDQLPELDDNVVRWNRLYRALAAALECHEGVRLPTRPEREHFVGSSLQFQLVDLDIRQLDAFADQCRAHGVEAKWFGDSEPRGYTSKYDSWGHLTDAAQLPQTDAILSRTYDIRLPLTFTESDCREIAAIIGDVLQQCKSRSAGSSSGAALSAWDESD